MPMTHALTLSLLPERFAIARLASTAPIPAWACGGTFWALTRTPDELSLVCPQAAVPADVISERDWCCLKVAGPLDFAATGILATLAGPLAQAGISLFALSTYDTDYLLVKADRLTQAVEVLRQAGHTVHSEG